VKDWYDFQTCPSGATARLISPKSATRDEWYVPWYLGANLASVERRAIGSSLRWFQSAETQPRHARELGRFLAMAGIPIRVRRLRIQTKRSIPRLMTAEILAVIYFAALRRASGSAVLRALCNAILCEKSASVRVLCNRQAWRQRKGFGKMMGKTRIEIAALAFWLHHAAALRSVGLHWVTFRHLTHRLHNAPPTDTTALLPNGMDCHWIFERQRERVDHP